MQRNNKNRRVVQQWIGAEGRLSELAVVRWGAPLLVGRGGDVVLGVGCGG